MKKGRNARRRKKILIWFRAYKTTLYCDRCEMSFKYHPECCEFHHRDPLTKRDCVANLVRVSMTALTEEILKCDPVCANCHKIIHESLTL